MKTCLTVKCIDIGRCVVCSITTIQFEGGVEKALQPRLSNYIVTDNYMLVYIGKY